MISLRARGRRRFPRTPGVSGRLKSQAGSKTQSSGHSPSSPLCGLKDWSLSFLTACGHTVAALQRNPRKPSHYRNQGLLLRLSTSRVPAHPQTSSLSSKTLKCGPAGGTKMIWGPQTSHQHLRLLTMCTVRTQGRELCSLNRPGPCTGPGLLCPKCGPSAPFRIWVLGPSLRSLFTSSRTSYLQLSLLGSLLPCALPAFSPGTQPLPCPPSQPTSQISNSPGAEFISSSSPFPPLPPQVLPLPSHANPEYPYIRLRFQDPCPPPYLRLEIPPPPPSPSGTLDLAAPPLAPLPAVTLNSQRPKSPDPKPHSLPSPRVWNSFPLGPGTSCISFLFSLM